MDSKSSSSLKVLATMEVRRGGGSDLNVESNL